MSIYSIFLVTNPVVRFKGSLKPSLVSELFQFHMEFYEKPRKISKFNAQFSYSKSL